MDNFIIICFSTETKYLNQLLNETQNNFGDSANQRGFHNKKELLQYLENHPSKEKIHLVILDLQDSNSITLKFLADVNCFAPGAIKLVTSESSHLLNIQEQIRDSDSVQFINRESTSDDFKIAFNTAKRHHSNLQILINHKSEISGFSKKLEKKVSTQLKGLMDSNLAKEKLFSIIAHDLKSPFTALLGISEILISDWHELSDKEKLDLVKGLKSSSENTYKLLENLLIWSNSQKEKIEADLKSFNATSIIKSAIKVIENNASQKAIKIENKVLKYVFVTADQNMISTVFRNLISNAVNYIPNGRNISISSETKENFCTFCIADNGNGVTESFIIKQFDRVNQNKNYNMDDFTGLGLILCKDFVERNGGNIWLETEKNKGSKFFFTVPLTIQI